MSNNLMLQPLPLDSDGPLADHGAALFDASSSWSGADHADQFALYSYAGAHPHHKPHFSFYSHFFFWVVFFVATRVRPPLRRARPKAPSCGGDGTWL